jgi:iron-sulfur cluster repair protein YtfE (RIC family)
MPEQQNSILSLMVLHHGLLEALFSVYKNSVPANKEEAKVALSNFRWEYEKHMFAEENVVFEFLKWNHPSLFETTAHLRGEHDHIRTSLQKLEADTPTEVTKEVLSLEALLAGHREDEETHLYPLLDKELLDVHKETIISRINEVSPKKT